MSAASSGPERNHSADSELRGRGGQQILNDGEGHIPAAAGREVKIVVTLQSTSDQFQAWCRLEQLGIDPVGHEGDHDIGIGQVGAQITIRPGFPTAIGDDTSSQLDQWLQSVFVNPVRNHNLRHSNARFPLFAPI